MIYCVESLGKIEVGNHGDRTPVKGSIHMISEIIEASHGRMLGAKTMLVTTNPDCNNKEQIFCP